MRQSGSRAPGAARQSMGLASGSAVRTDGSKGLMIQPFCEIGWPSKWA